MAPLTPEDLVELEQIKRVKYRYLRCLDQKLFDELADVLTEDCEAAYSGGAYTHLGRDAVIGFLRGAMGSEDMLTSHRVTQPEIDLTSPTTATGTWALDDTVLLLDWQLTVRGAAFYTDEYRKEGGRWRIARTSYRRTYEEVEPRDADGGLRLTAHWWATGGRSELEA